MKNISVREFIDVNTRESQHTNSFQVYDEVVLYDSEAREKLPQEVYQYVVIIQALLIRF
jgi:hypothetical protein